MTTVLVTRPQPAADEFAATLRQAGFKTVVAPLMEYAPLDTDLDDLASCQGLIFTSAYTVDAFCRLSKERHLPVFAVGDKTAETATRAGFVRVYSAQGDSSDVIAMIRTKAEKLHLKKIMHPCSEDTPTDIEDAAENFGIKVVHWPIYKAHFIDELPPDIMQALATGGIDTVTLFSARTAANLARMMQHMPDACRKIMAVCISERVVDALRHLPWRVIRVAERPDSESMIAAAGGGGRIFERRQRNAQRDERGYVQAPSYMGPDRRRTAEMRQYDVIMHEKMRIARRMMLTFFGVTLVLGIAGWLVLAPEYFWIKENTERQGIVGFFKSEIDKFRNDAGQTLSILADEAATRATDALNGADISGFINALGSMDMLQSTPEGSRAVEEALASLRHLLAQAPADQNALNTAIDAARAEDETLQAMLGKVDGKDLAAAALLLTLNEFRDNVDNSRPYEQDLAVLQKFAGTDPGMNKALARLAPYAEKGVMSRETLKTEFQGLATDIITAKLAGEDVSVREQALKRLDTLSKSVDADDVKGQETEAIVARAQVMLNNGDVKGAMAELRKLDGDAATAAAPWMGEAGAHIAADQASDALTEGILSAVSGASGQGLDSLVTLIKDTLRGGPDSVYISPSLKQRGGGASSVLAP